MLSRSCSILTRGHVAKNAITYVTSGYILKIETIIPEHIDHGGIGDKRKVYDEKKKKTKKIIRITIYIGNKRYVEEKEVDENIEVTQNNVDIKLRENNKPIITFKGII